MTAVLAYYTQWQKNGSLGNSLRHLIEHYGECLDVYLLKDTGRIPQMERPYLTAHVLMHTIFERSGVEGRGWKKVQ